MKTLSRTLCKILPWLLVATFAGEVIVSFLPKKDGEIHTREFGRLPVLLDGRVQPFDSVARNSLLQIRSTGDVPMEEKKAYEFWKHPKKLKASEWLLEVMLKPELADSRPIFLIHHPELLGELKLQDKGIEKSGLRYYTFNEIRSTEAEIREQGGKLSEIKPELRTPFQRQAIKLANAVVLYQKLKNSLRPERSDDFAKDLADFQKALGPGVAAARASEGGKAFDQAALDALLKPMQQFNQVAGVAYPLIVPPLPGEDRDHWVNAGVSLMEAPRDGEIHPAMKYFAAMATAYRQGQSAIFNRAVADYQQWLNASLASEVKKGRSEFYFNDTKTFLRAMIIYIAAFLLACGALLTFSIAPNLSESLRRSSFWLVVLGLIVHTVGLIWRMVIAGRPPVTNLYSSAIFIGWGAVILGLILERAFRLGLGCAVGSVAGFVTLTIAHNLALGGDTMPMLQAVLDTNFWLATHVTIVTLGYASTFVAGLLAVAYIFLGVFTPILTVKSGKVEIGKALAKMAYAIICFATLFSFTGTVLGGIWADQSWGRFWGWDPKENGALIIVLWNAVILHARWGGLVKDRGLMNMAIFGNVVTSWSWFGVNMLGIGLHSYGFMDAGAKWLYYIFMPSQLLIIGLGLLPLSVWRSFRRAKPDAVPDPSLGKKSKPLPA
jgi:ABC-type transport system involved in cytochrome c biogenesis permease subunit